MKQNDRRASACLAVVQSKTIHLEKTPIRRVPRLAAPSKQRISRRQRGY